METIKDFVLAVDDAYRQFDEERAMADRSLELSSRELMSANSQMRAVFQALPDLFLRLDDTGAILDCKGGETHGDASDEGVPRYYAVGRVIQDCCPDAMSVAFEAALRCACHRREPVTMDFEQKIAGRSRQFESRWIPLIEGQTLLVLRDITKRKLTEEALRNSEQLVRAILNSVGDSVFALDASQAVILYNQTAEMMFGLGSGEAIGLDVESVFRLCSGALSQANRYPQLLEALRTGRSAHFTALHMTRVGGQPFPADCNVRPVVDKEGRIHGTVLSVHDVTERHKMELELQQAQKLESVGRLASGVAHEINTPIQFVSDSIHFVRDAVKDVFEVLERLHAVHAAVLAGNPPEEMLARASAAEKEADLEYLKENLPKALERSLDGLNRVATIVRSMKEFAHPDQREMAPIDLNRAIASTLTIARNEYKYVAEVATEFDELPQIMCHAGDINQAILNIVVNAAHAIGDVVKDTENRGLITIKTRCQGNDAVILISDTGGGIPEDVRGRIFDPFFTTKEVGKGTGQGLAIARSVIVEKHEGELTFESEIGKGTTFTIKLPIQGKVKKPAEVAA